MLFICDIAGGVPEMRIFSSQLSICSRRQLGCAVVRDAAGHLGLVAVGGTGDTEQVSGDNMMTMMIMMMMTGQCGHQCGVAGPDQPGG